MANEREIDQNAMLRGLLETVATSGEISRTDNVAQLLAAALAASHSILTAQSTQPGANQLPTNDGEPSGDNFVINPQGVTVGQEEYSQITLEDSNVSATVEVPTSERPKPICMKFPIELRKQIIAMRKEGKKYKDIAKELKVSVSGVQKVWERFLATGSVHDRKPSTYAGRPRKYIYSQESPLTPGFETQYLGDGSVEVFHSTGSQMEYVTTPTSAMDSGGATNTVVISGDNEVFTEEPLDAPGATVEIVETPTSSTPGRQLSKRRGTPVYREQLLLKIIEDCPLATMRELPDAESNAHIQNLSSSLNKPLYLEYDLGHPFGKVPSPKPFEANYEEAQVILSDPSNPIGKELLAAIGYSTKVYFNACCKPSPLFDLQKVLSSLPLSVGPGHLADTMQTVLQLLLDLCLDPVAALERIPNGPGPTLVARTQDGEVASHGFPPPTKLSEYWSQLYSYASMLECCGNFFSATTPSAPCLLCHPFESFAQKLEIKDSEEPLSPISLPLHLSSPPLHHKAHTATPASTVAASEIEIEVLQSNVTPPSEAHSSTKRSRGRPKKVAGIQEPAQMEAVEEGRVVNDRQFSIPVPESDIQQSEVGEIMTTQTSGPQDSMPIILQAVEEAQIAASIAETQTQTTSENGTTGTVQVANTPQLDIQASRENDPANTPPKNQEGEGEVPQDLYSSKAVRLDHPYSESPWKKRSPDDAEGTGQHEQEGGEQQEGTSSPQKSRRSNRRTQGSSTTNKRAATAKQSSPTGEPSISTDTSTSRRTRSKGGKKVIEMETEDRTMSPPPAKRTRRAAAHKPQKHAEEERIEGTEKHPLEWGVEEVAEFVSGIPHCDYADIFKEHEVDGESLFSLDPEMMVKLMGLKTGPALRIHRKILTLKRQFTIPSLENK